MPWTSSLSTTCLNSKADRKHDEGQLHLLLLSMWPETGAYAVYVPYVPKALQGLSSISALPLLVHCALFQTQSWQKAQKGIF